MLREEFEQRTGIFVPSGYYAEIEKAYYDWPKDKDDFCKAYKKNINGLAERIRAAADISEAKARAREDARENAAKKREESLRKTIARFKKDLDRELEWKPWNDPNAMSQGEYDALLHSVGVHHLSDDEAKTCINEMFGFTSDCIRVLHTVSIYEINRHHQLRCVGTADRHPLNFSTDYNYVRFTCKGMFYEIIDGELKITSE